MIGRRNIKRHFRRISILLLLILRQQQLQQQQQQQQPERTADQLYLFHYF